MNFRAFSTAIYTLKIKPGKKLIRFFYVTIFQVDFKNLISFAAIISEYAKPAPFFEGITILKNGPLVNF